MRSSMPHISIHRHCMQRLLHEAMGSAPKPCGGLLIGSNSIIESALPAIGTSSHDMDTATIPLIGIYLSVNLGQQPDQTVMEELSALHEAKSGRCPEHILLLDLSQQGRIDATLFSDMALAYPQSLEMLEDGALYPVSSNR